jgi:hypothetical protein
MEATMSQREQISARLDPEVLAIVEHVAEVERRPVSSLVRNVLSDWARFVQQNQTAERQHDR